MFKHLLAAAMGNPAFTWGGTMGAVPSAEGDPVRAAYLDALRKADKGDPAPLVAFARS